MADFTTPQLIITNAGLAAASVAKPTGPFIEIVKFQVGSAYGYTPTKEDLSINGELLFEAAPLTYKYVGDNTLDILCRLPADAGPFEFGEVALLLPNDVLFAKAAFSEPQIKYSSLGTNVLSTYTFNCLLKLAQAVAVFKIDTLCTPPSIWEVDFWSDVYPADLSANPDIPAILVRELDQFGNSSLIHQADGTTWTVGTNYHVYTQKAVLGSSTTFVEIDGLTTGPDVVANTPREIVVGFDSGYLRSCSKVEAVGNRYRFTFIDAMDVAPAVGSLTTVYTNRPPVGQTRLNVTGDASGTVLIAGGVANMSLTISAAAAAGHTVVFDTPGTYQWTVPPEVTAIFLDGGGGGGGAGGAGGGWFEDRQTLINKVYPAAGSPGQDGPIWEYRAGGGGGGGGAGETEVNRMIAVTPGETITIVVGDKGIGGNGGAAPGGNASGGTAGGDSSVTALSETVVMHGGDGGDGGAGFGPPSNLTGAGGQPGAPGGFFGQDGYFGGTGGNGGSSTFGNGGPGGRAATIGSVPGGDGTGHCSGGGGAGAAYFLTSTVNGSKGGDGTVGLVRIKY